MHTAVLTQRCELGRGFLFMTLKFQFSQMKLPPTYSQVYYPTDSFI